MVKRTITITTILLVLSMIIGLIIVLNKSSFAADGDIASGTFGTCTWVIDSQGVLTIRPTDGVSGTLASDYYYNGIWYEYREQIKKVEIEGEVHTGNTCKALFYGFSKCTEINLNNLDTSNSTNIEIMFKNCSSLGSIDVSNLNTSNVTDMTEAFCNCSSLTELDLSNWNTSNATDISGLVRECSNLEVLKIQNFDTSKVTNMAYMFVNCKKLKSIDLSMWNTNSLTYMPSMFSGCSKVTSINLAGLDVANVWDMQNIFARCTSLEEVDISGWDTRNVSHGTNTFYMDTNLSRIVLSENYTLGGLPSSTKEGYTGKWIREDGAFGPYTALEFGYYYDGSIMAGTWILEKAKYTVSYRYIPPVPDEASALPSQETYTFEDMVTVAPNATAPGYTFNGWDRIGTFEMPAENVTITGSFTANTDTPYKVEHYLEDLNGSTYTLTKTDNLTGETDSEATANANDYEGFTFDDSIDGTKLSGNISADGSLVLKVYYKRNSYNVTYSYTGEIPNNASALPSMTSFRYEEEIVVADDASAEGYTFSGWIKDYINMPAQDIEITGYFIEVSKSYSYKVEYFFDGEMDNSLEEIMNAKKDEEISINPQSPLKHGEKNYTLVSNNHNITISINDEENVINVYYESDVLDYEFEYPEGDGIPDKYQIKIIFKVENGSWNDGTSEIKTNIVALYDEYGNLSEDGIGKISLPEVGNKPADGYTKGSWNKEIRNKISSKDDGNEYIYTYKKLETAKADIVEPGEKGANPKTGDIFYRYIVYGGLGALVLMTAVMIKRKYSRRARKIQY